MRGMRNLVADSFAGFASRLPTGMERPRLLGTSGTVTTLAGVHLGLSHYDRSAVDGLIVPAASMRRISSGPVAHEPCRTGDVALYRQ